ncbi:histone acetyltransferase HPA2 [Caldimonas brevitalea]|uniref:Histone acetyltransferase HPA2 n=2 Tax=Caldimonas brevitalea TaxID=413882 RepID=A0A0G3BLX5_9BURK|nr:histone acetyltransferase HPA2 [Caldimonas brevitalea]
MEAPDSDPIEVVIRPATRDDLPAVLALYEAAGLDAPGTHDLARAQAAFDRISRYPDYTVWLAELEARPVGTLALVILDNLAHGCAPSALVEDVAVAPDVQGQGLGRRLLTHAMQHARTRGCYKLALSSRASRVRSHDFYRHLGFEVHGYSFLVTLDDA